MFKLHSEYEPKGDQPKAIEQLVQGLNENKRFQTLLRSYRFTEKHILLLMLLKRLIDPH